MKRLVAVSFLLILLLPAFYKVGFFTYFQLNRDFIAENYCVNKDRPITMCYGQCFLNKGIQLVDDVPNPDRLTSTVRLEMPSITPDNFRIEFSVSSVTLEYPSILVPNPSEGVASAVFRPPLS
ncbi:MAG: hypothetical protein JSS79_17755 [Bacteroidetes bacterium]|nr:hypothetical protein [Bacteroidota bacterium]